MLFLHCEEVYLLDEHLVVVLKLLDDLCSFLIGQALHSSRVVFVIQLAPEQANFFILGLQASDQSVALILQLLGGCDVRFRTGGVDLVAGEFVKGDLGVVVIIARRLLSCSLRYRLRQG